MKLLVVLLIVGLAVGGSQAGSLSDTFKRIGDSLRTTFKNIGNQLKEVGHGLKDIAVHQVKAIAGDGLQAVIGAGIKSFQGLDIGKILFGIGKRDALDSEQVTVHEFVHSLEEEAGSLLEMVFHKTFDRYEKFIDNLENFRPVEEIKSELADIEGEHRLEVRGVIGDTLNSAIDGVRNLWNKAKALFGNAKDALLGSKTAETADPIMIGRRGLIKEAWQQFSDKVSSIKDRLMSRVEEVTQISTNMAAALGHHASKLYEHAKENAIHKVVETMKDLGDHLHKQLGNARKLFSPVRTIVQGV